jgi:hypothetical protein
MKITIESEGTKATIEDSYVVDIYEAIELCKKALLAVGYKEKSWDMAIMSASYEMGIEEDCSKCKNNTDGED